MELQKPATLRIIFISFLFKVFLCFGFFYAFSQVEDPILDPQLILYTAIVYTITFLALMTSILKRNVWAMRAIILVDFCISLPTKAYIGLLIATVGMILSFNGKVKAYLAQ